MVASMAVLPKAASALCSHDLPFLPSQNIINSIIFSFQSYSTNSPPRPLLSMRHVYCAGTSIPRSRVQALKASSKSEDSSICRVSLQAGIATAVDDSPKASSTDHETLIENRFPPYPTVLDINQIRDILPHRFPFLLVDRIVEYNPGVSAVGIKNVTINDNFFPGHFPDRPIMPGVLMVEAMAQVAGILMLQPDIGGSKENFFFAGVDKIRFRKPVVAGDTLVMRMDLIKLQKRFGIAKMYGKAYVGGEVVCEGEFLLSLGSD